MPAAGDLCAACRRVLRGVEPSPRRGAFIAKEAEKNAMRARLALIRAERTARQKKAMGLPP